MAKGGKLGVGFLVETDLNSGEDLRSCGGGRLATSRPPQDPPLNPMAAAQHRQYEMTIAERMVVEDQCFVVNDGHGAMVAEPGTFAARGPFLEALPERSHL